MIHPTEKKERSLGEHLHLKGRRCGSPKCAFVRKPYRPGAHGKGGRQNRALSDFGKQIREKQKCKVSYGLHERGLRQLFLVARKQTGSTGNRLMELLESRLDNVVFRLGIAPSRAMARQLVTHGHIVVNGKKVQSPGLHVQINSTVSVRAESFTKVHFRGLVDALKEHDPPSWLALDREKLEGRVLSAPLDIAPPFEVNVLVESFSK